MVEADGKEEGESEIEDVGPQERGKAAQGEREAVDEDVAAFKHEDGTSIWLSQAMWRKARG